MNAHKALKRASYLARFGYFGQDFHGLQPNKGVKTAGGSLAEVLKAASGQNPKALQFSARTDAGVHAQENYATFWFPRPFDHEQFALNLAKGDLLGLTYLELEPVPYNVHARACAHGKWYRYVIADNFDPEKLDSKNAWHIVPTIDLTQMQIGANYLVGTHAFDAFRHGDCSASNTIKTITAIQIHEAQQGHHRHIIVDIFGTGFLRRMVRIIIGTLAQVGAGLRKSHEVKLILEGKRRCNAGPSAPACGLTLMKIDFRRN